MEYIQCLVKELTMYKLMYMHNSGFCPHWSGVVGSNHHSGLIYLTESIKYWNAMQFDNTWAKVLLTTAMGRTLIIIVLQATPLNSLSEKKVNVQYTQWVALWQNLVASSQSWGWELSGTTSLLHNDGTHQPPYRLRDVSYCTIIICEHLKYVQSSGCMWLVGLMYIHTHPYNVMLIITNYYNYYSLLVVMRTRQNPQKELLWSLKKRPRLERSNFL